MSVRSFLPSLSDKATVSAQFDKSVLKVSLSKSPEAAMSKHKIEIKSKA